MHYRIPVYTVALVRERTLSQLQRPQMRTTADAAHVLSTYLADADRESLVVMLLNSKHRIIGIHTVSVGSLTSSLAHPREATQSRNYRQCDEPRLFFAMTRRVAIRRPPTKTMHSPKRMYAASKLVGVQLLDHIIIGDAGRWYSFQDKGALVQATLWRSQQSASAQGNRMCLSLENGKASSPLTKRCWPHARNWPYQGPHESTKKYGRREYQKGPFKTRCENSRRNDKSCSFSFHNSSQNQRPKTFPLACLLARTGASFPGGTPMLVGYARVSTPEQKLDLQRDALHQAGCDRIFTDVTSGARPNGQG